jgi:hypothetical protein
MSFRSRKQVTIEWSKAIIITGIYQILRGKADLCETINRKITATATQIRGNVTQNIDQLKPFSETHATFQQR